jgi:acetyl/propionyl-CoA carboxylase alpha subunit
MALLEKLLVANRGEIALRIIRSAKLSGIRTVAIYTESEKMAEYVTMADEKVSLGDGDLNSTFLNIQKIIEIAVSTNSDAIHPGYGFLSENPDFAGACEGHQIVFVGPDSSILRLMGNKPGAKSLASSLEIPVISSKKIDSNTAFTELRIEFPALIKASYGGGGKGMEIVNNHEELANQVERSSRMALNYFGNGELFVEKYIQNARHVEVQIIGDHFGNIIHLFERECSIQRNHQKILEEAPAIFLTAELRENLLSAALKIGKAIKYSGAGTVEFLIDETGNFFFIEMNPRIQVEHAVTEQITGIDIVGEQLKVASGFKLSVTQEQVIKRGHAVEIRIYTENPAKEFAPNSVALRSINLPSHPHLRIEADIARKSQMGNQFDPLLLKLIAWSEERQTAINLLRNTIRNLNIIGPETNTRYLETILAHTGFLNNDISVEFCKNNHKKLIGKYLEISNPSHLNYLFALAIVKKYLNNFNDSGTDIWKYFGYWRFSPAALPISVDGQVYTVLLNLTDKLKPSFVFKGIKTDFTVVHYSDNCMNIEINDFENQLFYSFNDQEILSVSIENIQYQIAFPGILKSYPENMVRSDQESKMESGEITSPLHGKILNINVKENQFIKKGDLLLVIEAMKSENRILSPKDALVKKIAVNVGTQVTDRMPLLFLEEY